MNIRQKKELLIEEIQRLRALVSDIKLKPVKGSGNLGSKVDEDSRDKVYNKINEIHDIIFNM